MSNFDKNTKKAENGVDRKLLSQEKDKILQQQKIYALLKFLKIHHKFQKFSKSQNSACRFKATSQIRAVSLTKAVPQKANSTHKKPSHAKNGRSES